MDELASTSWLDEHFDEPDMAVLDWMVRREETESGFQNRSGSHDHLRGRIPGAGFADLKGALPDPVTPMTVAI